MTVSLDGGDLVRAVRADPDCPRGAAYLVRDEAWDGPTHPVRVRIRAGDRSRRAAPAPVAAARASPPARAAPAATREVAVVAVVERRMLVPNVHILTVEAPEVADSVRPGNFIILRPDEQGERIPLTVADWDAAAGTVTSVFVQVGASTAKLARLKAGDTIPSYAGPLGNETEIAPFGTVLLIGGCYGLGSLLPIARAMTAAGNRVFVILEARSSLSAVLGGAHARGRRARDRRHP